MISETKNKAIKRLYDKMIASGDFDSVKYGKLKTWPYDGVYIEFSIKGIAYAVVFYDNNRVNMYRRKPYPSGYMTTFVTKVPTLSDIKDAILDYRRNMKYKLK